LIEPSPADRRIETMAHPLAGTVVAPLSESDAAPPPEPDVASRLREQNAQIAQLAGGLAHEIRNPLSTLSLNLDLLAEDFQEPETPRERRAGARIERLKHEARRLQDILENFLRFARLQDLRIVPTDLNAVVEELCDFYEPQASTRGVMVRTCFAADLPRVRLDADAFKQAVLNLMLNAENAMPDGGELILTTRRDGGEVVLDVVDTGRGIPEEIAPRIFDPFFSTRKGGTGLGLPTTRNIILAHGGTIEAQSVPNRGSRFSVRFPAA
jgi:signal transduction histidine kinase